MSRGLRDTLRAWFTDPHASRLQKIIRAAQILVALPALLLLTMWIVSPLRDLVQPFIPLDADGILSLVGALSAIAVLSLDDIVKAVSALTAENKTSFGDISRTISTLRSDIERLKSAESLIIERGIGEVYETLRPMLRSLEGPQKTLDVLGLTLFTAWPQLANFLKNHPEEADWKLRLLCLDPTFHSVNAGADAGCRVPGLPDEWLRKAEAQMGDIRRFAQRHRKQLEERRISLAVHGYRAFPAIHGFRLGDGSLIVSWVQWEGNELADPDDFYELFPNTDQSVRAIQYRGLFANWFDHALSTADEDTKAAP